MNDATYVFRLSSYDAERLLPQVSRALEARTQQLSRERYPGLWKATDRLRGKEASRPSSLSRVLALLFIAVGLFLFLPGLMRPRELAVPLLAGAFSMLYGVLRLRRSGRDPNSRVMEKRFDQAARQMLTNKDFSDGPPVTVTFDSRGMTIAPPDAPEEQVLYTELESVTEGEDLLLLVWKERTALLQKKDLVQGDPLHLYALLREKVQRYLTV